MELKVHKTGLASFETGSAGSSAYQLENFTKSKIHTSKVWLTSNSMERFPRVFIIYLLTTKIVHFIKLSKCGTDFTIAFLPSRRPKNKYGMPNLESGWSYVLEKMLHCRKFQPKLGVSTHVGSSGTSQEFWQTPDALTRVGSLDLSREF